MQVRSHIADFIWHSPCFPAALVERLSLVQRERERTLAAQLRKVMEEKEELVKKLKDRGHEIKYVRILVYQNNQDNCP